MPYIYALVDPHTDSVRYVGKADDPKRRLQDHLRDARNGLRTHKACWLRQLDGPPKMRLLEKVEGDWVAAERAWIAKFRAEGADLTNGTDGGEGGVIPASFTPEANAKRAAANRGQRRTPESRRLMAERATGRPKPANSPPPPVRRGADNNQAVLTEADVVRLRRLHSEGIRGRALADLFGITPTNAWFVATRRTWQHVT